MQVTVQALNVYIRGTRDYVQGSQILARTAELVGADDSTLLASAKFTQITEREVLAVFDDADGGECA